MTPNAPSTTQQPTIAGFAVRRPLRATGDGPPWLAVELASGLVVVVRPGGETHAGTDLPRHPHLLVAQQVRDVDGRAWTTSAYAAHGGLDQLLGDRRLLPGEVVTVGVAVARALAMMHDRGLAHCALVTASVVVDADGRPMLDASSVRRGTTGPVEQMADLSALCGMLLEIAEEPLPDKLGSLLRRVAASDRVDDIVGAADLVRELTFACPPKPLTLPVIPATAGMARQDNGRQRWPALRQVGGRALAVAGGLAVAVLLGLGWAHFADRASETASGPRSAPRSVIAATDLPVFPAGGRWEGILSGLDQARVQAFELADPAGLGSADAPGSSALARDGEALAALVNQRLRPRGQALSLESVRLLRSDGRRVLLAVADRASAYTLVGSDGRAVVERPSRGPTRWTVELAWFGGRWLVSDTTQVS